MNVKEESFVKFKKEKH